MSDLFEDKNISPMLLYETQPFDDENYIYELKLDGIRCLAYIESKSVVLQNKRHKDVTAIYPELSQMNKCVKRRVILDGELVVLNKDGKPDFYALQRRSLMTDSFKSASRQRAIPFNSSPTTLYIMTAKTLQISRLWSANQYFQRW